MSGRKLDRRTEVAVLRRVARHIAKRVRAYSAEIDSHRWLPGYVQTCSGKRDALAALRADVLSEARAIEREGVKRG